jgi:hypothetical protein
MNLKKKHERLRLGQPDSNRVCPEYDPQCYNYASLLGVMGCEALVLVLMGLNHRLFTQYSRTYSLILALDKLNEFDVDTVACLPHARTVEPEKELLLSNDRDRRIHQRLFEATGR